MTSPCDWPVSYAGCTSCAPFGLPATEEDPQTEAEAAAQATFEAVATEYLWHWTGRRYGLCPVVLRPCRADCLPSTFWGNSSSPSGWGGVLNPALVAGSWVNLSCGACAPLAGCGCSLDSTKALELPGPVAEVTEVVIDGAVLAEASWRLDGNVLWRVDGRAWPSCQYLERDLTEEGTWSIAYTRGVAVPMGGQIAAGLLACELAKAACRDSSCALPQRVQTITRQGVTVAMLDAFDDIENGHTGIWVIDSWIASVTAAQKRVGGRIYSVDIPRRQIARGAPPPV